MCYKHVTTYIWLILLSSLLVRNSETPCSCARGELYIKEWYQGQESFQVSEASWFSVEMVHKQRSDMKVRTGAATPRTDNHKQKTNRTPRSKPPNRRSWWQSEQQGPAKSWLLMVLAAMKSILYLHLEQKFGLFSSMFRGNLAVLLNCICYFVFPWEKTSVSSLHLTN